MLPIVSSLTYPWSSLLPQRVLPAVKAASKAASVACLLAVALPASSQRPIKPPAQYAVKIPASSHADAADAGVRMHTNVRYMAGFTPDELPPFSGFAYETPASLACVYGLVSHTEGCNPNLTTHDSTGGSQTIAIVDAFDDPNAAADLAFFSSQFGLPFSSSKFQVVYASGSQPPEDPTGGWEFEESVDIEYSHAMAPNATIYLVEANSNGSGDLLPVVQTNGQANPEYERWLSTNVRGQKQTGYAIVTVKVPQGNLTGKQMHALASIARDAGDGLLRVAIDQNLVLGFIPLRQLPRIYAALEAIDLAGAGAEEIDDITTCPGAYSCNLALTKSMNLGAALTEEVRDHPDRLVRKLKIKISGCPNSCGQHWISDFGFYGNARKIDGKEVPYYQMLLGGGYDQDGMLRFGAAIQSIPARLAPEAVRRVLHHYVANRQADETFRAYVLRHKVETFRVMTNDLAKPAELYPEMYRDWGDDVSYSLQLGRGECAS